MAITLNFKKDNILTDYSVGMLKDFYLRGDEKSPQEPIVGLSNYWGSFYVKTSQSI